GYVEGKDFVMEWRFAEGHVERLPALAEDLVQSNVDIIVATFTNAAKAAQRATRTIPIVIGYSSDPIGNGLVKSLARPGGNVTGLSSMTADTISKQLGLLARTLPNLSSAAVLFNPSNEGHSVTLQQADVASKQAGIELLQVGAQTIAEIEAAFGL